MDKTNSNRDTRELRVILDYPEDIGLPKYCNFVQIKFTNYEYTFDFASIDPKELKDDLPDDIIKATVVQRVCMNHEVAKLFLKAFTQNNKKYDEVSRAKK